MLEEQVKKSISLSDLVRKLTNKEKVHGSMVVLIKKKLLFYNINFDHFIGRSKPKSSYKSMTKEEFIENYLSLNAKKKTSGTNLKYYLFKFGFKDNVCEECGLKNIWNNKEISLQLEHINGNNLDNRIDNLKILCPNCHSQTETYAGKKNKGIKNEILCLDCGCILKRKRKTGYCHDCYYKHIKKEINFCDCGAQIYKDSKKCRKCNNLNMRKVEDRPSIECLLKDVETIGYRSTGKKYGVSDNTIRKWIKLNNMEAPIGVVRSFENYENEQSL